MKQAAFEAASWAFIALALGTVVRSLALACFSGCAVSFLRSKTAALRFMLWNWTLLALFALPVLVSVTPPLSKPLEMLAHVETVIVRHDSTDIKVRSLPTKPRPSRSSNFARLVSLLPVFYLLGAFALLIRLRYNLQTLEKIGERSQLIPDEDFRELSHDVWLKSHAMLTPRIRVSKDISSPVTFEADDIWILLPECWRTWEKAKLRSVLAHEMAHVERRDCRTFLLASFGTCIFWFHPLSWFLRHQLAVSAEEACDEVVVGSESTPEQYAGFLIDFARDVQRERGRLVGAIGMAATSSLGRRIEHLFLDRTQAQRGKRISVASALVLFLSALYLTAAAQPQPASMLGQSKSVWPRPEQVYDLSAGDVQNLEAAVQSNPEDLDSRMQLLVYFSLQRSDEAFTEQLVWFIDHHPDLDTLSMAGGMRGRGQLNDVQQLQISEAWERSLARYPDSPAVLRNAALSLESKDPEQSLALLRKARVLDNSHPERYDSPIALILGAAEIQDLRPGVRLNNIRMDSDVAIRLRQQLSESQDPALLAEVGQLLVKLIYARAGDLANGRGFDLIRQAIDLDPTNPKWTEALESAQAEPQRRHSFDAMMSSPPQQSGTVRIGAKIAETSLIRKVDPDYPPVARQARLSGVVEFTVTVGTDGKVQDVTLVRGHPLLVNAARSAVLKYVYQPASVDGKLVPFETEVLVPFAF